jgi:hypothetical protein
VQSYEESMELPNYAQNKSLEVYVVVFQGFAMSKMMLINLASF